MLRRNRVGMAASVGYVALAGCIDLTVNAPDTLLATGSSFVVSGEADMMDGGNGPCLVWHGDNGADYHLFQGGRVENEQFDQVTTPGTRSRLEIATRSDLFLDCQFTDIVEVQGVLEIEP